LKLKEDDRILVSWTQTRPVKPGPTYNSEALYLLTIITNSNQHPLRRFFLERLVWHITRQASSMHSAIVWISIEPANLVDHFLSDLASITELQGSLV